MIDAPDVLQKGSRHAKRFTSIDLPSKSFLSDISGNKWHGALWRSAREQ